MKLVTPSQMASLDQRQIASGTPSIDLMERAGHEATEIISDIINQQADGRESFPIVIVAGFGNNGGDCEVIARLLREKNQDVTLIFTGSEEQAKEKMTPDSKTNFGRLPKDLTVLYANKESMDAIDAAIRSAAMIVDGIFGTGFKTDRPVREPEAGIIDQINQSDAIRVSIDIPSGLNGENGQASDHAVQADDTITIQLPKTGMYLNDGPDYAGKIHPVDIGINTEGDFQVQTIDPASLGFPAPRKKNSHKYHYGQDLIIAGSKGMTGAAALCAKAAITTGAGLVRCYVDEEIYPIEGAMMPPEILISPYHFVLTREELYGIRRDAILFGPGIGRHMDYSGLLTQMIKDRIPLVIDADGLWHLKSLLTQMQKDHGPIILTPHTGEFTALTGMSMQDLQKDPIEAVCDFAKTYSCVLVLKGYRTLIADPSGNVTVNTTGNPGMATAGSGDVLAGMITAILGQTKDALQAAQAGVYYHGLAGDWYEKKYGPTTLTAGRLIDCLKEVLH